MAIAVVRPQPNASANQPLDPVVDTKGDDRWKAISLLCLCLIALASLIYVNVAALQGDISLETIGIINLPINVIMFFVSCLGGPTALFAIPPVIYSSLAIAGLGTVTSAVLPVLIEASIATIIVLVTFGIQCTTKPTSCCLGSGT